MTVSITSRPSWGRRSETCRRRPRGYGIRVRPCVSGWCAGRLLRLRRPAFSVARTLRQSATVCLTFGSSSSSWKPNSWRREPMTSVSVCAGRTGRTA
ncbi:MAG: hypothetical protein ACK56I_37195 [bacterium]